jgi:sporulation protein YlmC with PRC-barrel domain
MTGMPPEPTPALRSLFRTMLTGLALSCAILTAAEAQMAQTTDQTQTPAPPPDAAGQTPRPAVSGIDDAALARSARASKLIGSTVYSAGENVGKIDDILIDREHAAVTGAILSVGGFLGVGEKRIAVPITEIKIGNEAKFTINMSKDDLKNAPAFDYAKLN